MALDREMPASLEPQGSEGCGARRIATIPMHEDGNLGVSASFFQGGRDKLVANWKPVDDVGAILVDDWDALLLGNRPRKQPANTMRPRAKEKAESQLLEAVAVDDG